MPLKRIAGRRRTIERELQGGASQLRQMTHQTPLARTAIKPILVSTLKDLTQAEMDAGSLTAGRPLGIAPIALPYLLVDRNVPLKARLWKPTVIHYNQHRSEVVTGRPRRQSHRLRSTTNPEHSSTSLRVSINKARQYQQAIGAYQEALRRSRLAGARP